MDDDRERTPSPKASSTRDFGDNKHNLRKIHYSDLLWICCIYDESDQCVTALVVLRTLLKPRVDYKSRRRRTCERCTKQKLRMWVNLRILCATAFRNLSLLQAVNPSGEGSATRVLLLQSSRSSTFTGVKFRLMRSCEMVFIQLFLCLHRFRCPYTSASRTRLMLDVVGHVRTISVLTHVSCL